jgi:hypothetical protein
VNAAASRLRRVAAHWGLLLWAFVGAASAHTRSETYSTWEIVGSTVHVAVTVPKAEAARLATGGAGVPSDEQVAAYLARRISVTAGGKDCPAVGAPRPGAATEELRRVEFTFHCAEANDMVLHSSAFFDLVPSHVTYARIRQGDDRFIEQLITQDHRDLAISGAGADDSLKDASFVEYIRLGVMHILTGPDHLAFVLGFVLISRRLRDLVFVITGFTIGHSVTLALAVTGIVRPHTAFIDILIALTIALIGAENIAVAVKRPLPVAMGCGALLVSMALARLFGYGSLPVSLLLGAGLFSVCYLMSASQLHDAARVRLVVTLIFGLIHGFAFANDLIEMQLPPNRLVELLFGFNLGVESGQLLVVGLLTGAAHLLTRIRLALPRPVAVDIIGSGLVCLGVFWVVSRNYAG